MANDFIVLKFNVKRSTLESHFIPDFVDTIINDKGLMVLKLMLSLAYVIIGMCLTVTKLFSD